LHRLHRVLVLDRPLEVAVGVDDGQAFLLDPFHQRQRVLHRVVELDRAHRRRHHVLGGDLLGDLSEHRVGRLA